MNGAHGVTGPASFARLSAFTIQPHGYSFYENAPAHWADRELILSTSFATCSAAS